jgi:hypothetical protein
VPSFVLYNAPDQMNWHHYVDVASIHSEIIARKGKFPVAPVSDINHG